MMRALEENSIIVGSSCSKGKRVEWTEDLKEQSCLFCDGALECTEDYIGGGSHYYVFHCPACKRRFTLSTYDFTLREWPLSSFEELAQAKEDFKQAMWEYHPFFILARRILAWLESLQTRIRIWNPRHIPNPFFSPSLAVSESLRKAWEQPEIQDMLGHLAADIAFRCAMQGHTYRSVPGIQGAICVACGERPEVNKEHLPIDIPPPRKPAKLEPSNLLLEIDIEVAPAFGGLAKV